MDCKQRMWLTKDKERLVPDGHPDAAFLFATVGMNIQDHDAKRFGIVDGTVPKVKMVKREEVEDKELASEAQENKGVTRKRHTGSGLKIKRKEAAE